MYTYLTLYTYSYSDLVTPLFITLLHTLTHTIWSLFCLYTPKVVDLNDAIKIACESSEYTSQLTFVDIMSEFGGSATTYSKSEWYGDNSAPLSVDHEHAREDADGILHRPPPAERKGRGCPLGGGWLATVAPPNAIFC